MTVKIDFASHWQTVVIAVAAVLLVTNPAVWAQDAGRRGDPAPTRERAGGQPRVPETRPSPNAERQFPGRPRIGTPEGVPDGQPEVQIAPRGNSRIVRPPVLPNRWHLGVYAYDTERGVMITDVVPGSPAAMVGLEPRDLIVTVGGFQVGYVGDRYYPLGDELQNRSDPRGRVRMLVQNRRNNELVNIDVPLERHGSYYRRER